MSVNLDKNKSVIQQVYNDVLNEKSDTDWALFGYEGQTNVIKVVSFGDDGLDGLSEDLNASKVMYAVVRVTDPKTSRPKIVLINWVGEGAPNLRKGLCGRHLPDVRRFFKGVHITVSARTEEEVEFGVIINEVMKASATDYNFQDRSEMPDKNIPVGTNYKRTNPQSELNSNNRNKFWEKQEAEEKVRKEEEMMQREEEAKRLELQRIEREEKDAKRRAQIDRERNAKITAERKAETDAAQRTTNTSTSTNTQQWQDYLADSSRDELERVGRADNMRMERKKEAESLIGGKTHQARSMFEAQSSTRDFNAPSFASKNRPPKVLKDFSPQISEQTTNINSTKKDDSVPKRVGVQWPPPSHSETSSPPSVVPGRIADWKPIDAPGPYLEGEQILIQNQFSYTQNPIYKSNHEKELCTSAKENPPTKATLISTSHTNPPINDLEPINEANDLPDSSTSKALNSHVDEPFSNGIHETEVSNHVTNAQDHDENSADLFMIYEVDGVEYQILPEHGMCARALYDYQAADETEITFDPGDIITGIDQIDVGWWQGVSPLGLYGLFPANYVELINGTRIH